MSSIIRKLVDTDLPEVEKLFTGKKVLSELRWLFSDPDNESEINAYVAVIDGKIAGVLGYSFTDFALNGKLLKGIIPMSWMVAEEHRGLAGIQLLKEVLKQGEFGFAITLSKTAIQVFPIAKLKLRTHAAVYQKILWPYSIKSGIKKYIFSVFGFVYGKICGLFSRRDNDLKFKSLSDTEIILEHGEVLKRTPGFSNYVTLNKIRWLLRCPVIDKKRCFQIKIKDTVIGYVVCYIKKNKRGVTRGRIIHISYLGEETGIWKQVINGTEKLLRKEGCRIVTVLAKNKTLVEAIRESGYSATSKNFGIYFNDKLTDIPESAIDSWNLTFAISDKGYRGI